MAGTVGSSSTQGSHRSIVGALVGMAAMRCAAAVAFAGFILGSTGFDVDRPVETWWSPLRCFWLSAAIILFVGSGPVAVKMGGRRWLWFLPFVAVGVGAVGLLVTIGT